MNSSFHRLGLIAGSDALNALGRASVLVFGAGGVGSWCAEALVRSGVGSIGIVDADTVCVTNINRQVQADICVIGKPKAEVLKARLLKINPQADVQAWISVFSRESAGQFNIEYADYVIDAIDSLHNKLDLIEIAYGKASPDRPRPRLFSSMGAALKLDPTRLKTANIWETRACPLARLVRAGLRKRGFTGNFTVVYSDERLPPQNAPCLAPHGVPQGAPQGVPQGAPCDETENPCGTSCRMCEIGNRSDGTGARENTGAAEGMSIRKRAVNGSAVTVTASAGMILASLVIRDICAKHGVGSFPS